ncbi:CPBP family intramembrane glutamic endopeptidase [Gemmatimonadota bacterium]
MNPSNAAIHVETAVVVALFVLGYATFHRDMLAAIFIRPFADRLPDGKEQAYTLFLRRFSTIFTVGLVPLTTIFIVFGRGAREYGIGLPDDPLWFLAGFVFCLVILPIMTPFIRKPNLGNTLPRARIASWNRNDRTWNAISWICYLAAYEAGLRGYVLFALMRSVGIWPAILVMTAIYVFIHLDKPWEEVIGSALMGPVFGLIALYSGSVLIPWLMHSFIANATDILVLRSRDHPVTDRSRASGA